MYWMADQIMEQLRHEAHLAEYQANHAHLNASGEAGTVRWAQPMVSGNRPNAEWGSTPHGSTARQSQPNPGRGFQTRLHYGSYAT